MSAPHGDCPWCDGWNYHEDRCHYTEYAALQDEMRALREVAEAAKRASHLPFYHADYDVSMSNLIAALARWEDGKQS